MWTCGTRYSQCKQPKKRNGEPIKRVLTFSQSYQKNTESLTADWHWPRDGSRVLEDGISRTANGNYQLYILCNSVVVSSELRVHSVSEMHQHHESPSPPDKLHGMYRLWNAVVSPAIVLDYSMSEMLSHHGTTCPLQFWPCRFPESDTVSSGET